MNLKNPGRWYLSAAGLVALLMLASGTILPAPGRAQSPGNTGKDLFEKRCSGCHALDKDKEGPRLGGVYGRLAGTVQSFDYSAALKKSGIKWNDESLDKWLTDPEKLVPENDMTFHVANADERREIIAFLKRNSPGSR
jgi:cytochrome c